MMTKRNQVLRDRTDEGRASMRSSLENECEDYAASHGLLVRKRNANQSEKQICQGSMTLIPSVVSSNVYNQALSCQPAYNELYHKVARDTNLLREALIGTIESDPFIRHLWKILEAVQEVPAAQKLSLGLLRSDYMTFASSDGSLHAKQIEMNTIASSLAGLSSVCLETHRYLARLHPNLFDVSCLPSNDGLLVLALGLVEAWRAYGSHSSVILVIVNEEEGNFSDIRRLQYKVQDLCRDIRVVYSGFDTMLAQAKLGESGQLLLNETEVAVVYYRHGYSPEHYPSSGIWSVRLLIEKSLAIKCPSVALQLAGCKKVQQYLVNPGVLERYLTGQQADQVRNTFVALYALSKEAGGDELMNKVCENPSAYILKPQREGGGNNYHNKEILSKWEEIKEGNQRDAFILMDRICPPTQLNICIPRKSAAYVCEPMVNELGIYGAVLGDDSQIFLNETGGYLLRTKPVDVSEGGFYAGYSSMDTPLLVSDKEVLSNTDA